MDQSPLFERTVELLKSCDLPLAEIATMSGLGYEWLKKLKAEQIPDPSVNRIQALHDFLAQRIEA